MTFDEIKKDIAGTINMVDGTEFKMTLRAICEVAADTVKKTLGPFASTTVLDNGVDGYSTKDGWSVLENLHSCDPLYETIYRYIKNISFTLNSRVGDGTTTALVVADHFVRQFELMKDELKRRGINVRQADLMDEIQRTTNDIITKLHEPNHLKMVKSMDDIYNIAYVSTNRNEVISKMIKDIYTETNNPNIHVAMSDTSETYYKVNRGYKLDCHLMWHEMYCNEADEYVLPNGCNVYVFDHMLKFHEHHAIITAILSIANQTGVDAVIFAPSFDDLFMSAIGSSIKAIKGMPNSALVQVSMTNTALRNYAMDFAALSGAEVFSYTKVRMFNYLQRVAEKKEFNKEEFENLFENEDYREPEDIINQCRGFANRLTLAKRYALLEEFPKDSNLYKAVLTAITNEYKEQKARIDKHADTLDPDYMNAHLRYIKFIGNTGIIYVGGDTELSKKCLRDAVLDATLACRSAFEQGYISGLNIETISVIEELWADIDNLIAIIHEDDRDATKAQIREQVLISLAASFVATSMDVMMNKFINDGEIPEKYDWNIDNPVKRGLAKRRFADIMCDRIEHEIGAERCTDLHLGMIDVIMECAYSGKSYDIVTETQDYNKSKVINSVATDCEILKAATSIISMLLSSNQMISLNKRFDAQLNKERGLQATEEDAAARMRGYLSAIQDDPNPLSENWTLIPTGLDERVKFIPTHGKVSTAMLNTLVEQVSHKLFNKGDGAK